MKKTQSDASGWGRWMGKMGPIPPPEIPQLVFDEFQVDSLDNGEERKDRAMRIRG